MDRGHRTETKLQASNKYLTPYTRGPSTSSCSFNARNLNIPKGRIHSPNKAKWKTDANHKNVQTLKLTGDYSSPGIRRQNENMNCDLRFTSQLSGSFPVDFLPEDMENKCQQNPYKSSVHMTGSLKLTETQQNLNYRVKGTGKGEGTNLKPETGQKSGGFDKNNNRIFGESQFRRKENLSRILTGTVEKVMHWFRLKNYFNVLFEVIAVLVEVKQGTLPGEKCLILKDEKSGPSLFVKYYEIDIKLPPIDVGAVVKCIGRLLSRNNFQAFKIVLSSEEERAHSQRLFFISNLVAEEAKTVFSKK